MSTNPTAFKGRQLPADYNAFRQALARELERVTGCVCVLGEAAYQNASRPGLPYFMFKITTPGAKFGDDWQQYTGVGTQFAKYGQRRMSVSFHCYAEDQEQAYNLMTLWQCSLGTWATQQQLREAGVAIWLIGTVADLSQLLNTGYEARAQMDVQFGVTTALVEDLGEIASVEGTGTVQSDSGTVSEEFSEP